MSSQADVVAAVRRSGLLLVQDSALPSAVSMLAGGPVRGSWWAHPQAHALYAALETLGERPDLVTVKLLARKLTFVHRRLWPALVTVAGAREAWQTRGLPPAVRRRLAHLEGVTGPAAKILDERLLARGERVHTPSGKHELRLEPWADWARRVGIEPLGSLDEAKGLLEAAAAKVGAQDRLPWHQK